MKKDPGYFSGVDFRAANNYRFRFVTYKSLKEPEGQHLTDKGSKVTLWLFATWRKPYQIGYNIALIKVFAYTAESILHCVNRCNAAVYRPV